MFPESPGIDIELFVSILLFSIIIIITNPFSVVETQKQEPPLRSVYFVYWIIPEVPQNASDVNISWYTGNNCYNYSQRPSNKYTKLSSACLYLYSVFGSGGSQRLVYVQSTLKRRPGYRTLERDLIQLQQQQLFQLFVVVSLRKRSPGNAYYPEITQQFPTKVENQSGALMSA